MGLGKPKQLVWIGSSRRDMRALPTPIRRAFGVALFAAQYGETPPAAKPLKGLGSGVLELVEYGPSGTFRSVYTVGFTRTVYVLHVFQKKSKSGRATPPRDLQLIKQRLARAAAVDAGEEKEER